MVAVRQLAQRLVGDISRTRAAAPPQNLCHPDDRAAQARPIITARPFIGVLAVLLGSVISTLDSPIILSTSYIIPQYLITVQNYRAIEIGGVIKWVALPQFLSTPLVATILRFVDARVMMALGFALVGCACFMAGQLTQYWVGDDFLPSQFLQAVGQSLGLTSLVWFALQHLEPSEIFTFGAVLQTGRLFGAQVGNAFVQTFVRTREQTYSNLIGLHVNTGSLLTDQRLEHYAKIVGGRSVGDPQATARATVLLARAVQNQAYVLAYIDAFMVLGFAVVGALLLMLLLRDPPAHLEQTAARK
jgi:MFS transporter, DHA2 family, multidrug resistance protein